MLKTFSFAFAAAASLCLSAASAAEKGDKPDEAKVPAALNFKLQSLDGKEVELSKYNGQVVLVVNVASKCGLTPQYEQLQALHEKYAEKGLAILGFPCNQFNAQEPGTADEIREFCTAKYRVSFDLFAKVDVNGEEACPLYKYLTSLNVKPAGEGKISWNFEKFIINRQGEVVARFAPRTKPNDPEILKVLETELGK